jgi:electron transfer flavoprotein beta subunit
MKICVLVKPIIDSGAVQYNYLSGNFEAISYVFNPVDLHALQWACDYKEKYGAAVTVCIVEAEVQQITLDKLLKTNIDECIVIQSCGGDDQQENVAYTMARELEPLQFDVILSGTQSADRHGGVIPILLAEQLRIPSITGIHQIEPMNTNEWLVQREDGGVVHKITVHLPAVIGILGAVARKRYQPRFSKRQQPSVTYKQAEYKRLNESKTETIRVTEPKPNIKVVSTGIPPSEQSAQQRTVAVLGFSSQGTGALRDKLNDNSSQKHIHYTAQKIQAWLKEG